jgi:hypothetical protein
MEVEAWHPELEADEASGTDTDFDSASDFNDSIETRLLQTTAFIALGFEIDAGVTFFGKIGYAWSTMEQDIGAGSVLGPPDQQQGGVLDPYVAFGFGAEVRREVGQNMVVLGRAQFIMGQGDVKDYIYHDELVEGDFLYRRIEFRGAFGYQMETATLYFGARFNLLLVELDVERVVPGEDYDVEYELDTPVGIFAGVMSRLGERANWHAEVGFVDGISFEVGAGMDF